MSLQVCVCGWSKVTSYHGLRIHQGKMGCMQNGVMDPERRSYPRQTPPTGRPIQLSEPDNFIPPPIDHSPQTLTGHIHPAAAVITAAETREPFFQTPEPPPRHQTATNTYRPRRALEFSTGAEQTTPPTTAVHPTEEEEEEQREAEKLRMKAELQCRVHIRKLKMAELELSVKGLKVSLDTEWLEINNVFSEVKNVVKDAQQRALQPLKERKQSVKREGKDLLQRLKRETVKLQKTIAELDGNLDLQISLDEATDWNNTSVDTLEGGLCSPLPMILLSNVNSLSNKMDELRLLITTNRDFALSSFLCFTESWLTKDTPVSDVELTGFQLLRADCDPKRSGKKRGGGICFYINHGWCSDVTEILKSCSPDLETFFIDCRPFYSPHEFTSFILAGVYIHPKANVREAQRQLAEQIQGVKRRREHKTSTVIILGDFNKANLPQELHEYEQFVKCPTRGKKTLDHCYSTINKAYHAVSHAALGLSDHNLIHLIPASRQKPDVLRCQNWSSREAVDELRDSLDNTDWETFRTASNSLEEYTDAVTSYISFCEDRCIPTQTWVSYNNDKPWFTAELKQRYLEKEAAFKSGDMDEFKLIKNLFVEEMKKAKQQYKKKLNQQLAAKPNSPKTLNLQTT
ncbi:uncharacterized protein LOC128430167 [Pleuronectes platessa]|uniref:uncharacterized protein LOC128430167 n=1 Tax=Pleuronectes platessa TaxID=8262 RepID=UPI00232A0FB9|nr:uncharacterized protein LOC128430167 [Pleuronectes platessa]XP_053272126.1 uncharacterized protein LOC128430167 [Pleuronectes platessa]